MNTQASLAIAQVASVPAVLLPASQSLSLKAFSSSSSTGGHGLRLVKGFGLSLSKKNTDRPAPAKRSGRVVVSSVATEEVEVGTSPAVVEIPVVETKKAAPAAVAAIALSFPNAIEYESFIHATREALFELGFTKDNCIALVNTCRDEVCRPLVQIIDKEYGHSFNVSGLGGLVTCGVTGLRAGMSHSPEHPCDIDGTLRERYVFFAFPHISIGESGQEGSLLRRGRNKPSSACGALIAVKGSFKDSPLKNVSGDSDDWEFELLKKKVLAKNACKDCGEGGPTLVAVTKAAQEVICEDLEDLISKTVDSATADYAVITGVQIHSGCQVPGEPFSMERIVDYIAPSTMYAVIRGERYVLHCEVNQITKISSIKAEKSEVAESSARAEEKVKVKSAASASSSSSSVDIQAELDEGRAAMRDWWLEKLEEEKLGASKQAEMDVARAEMRSWWLAKLEKEKASSTPEIPGANQEEMDKSRAEMRTWWEGQLEEKKEREASAAVQAEMDKGRAEMRAWWTEQLEQKVKRDAIAKQAEMDKGRVGMREWWLSQLEEKEKARATASRAAAQEDMDKGRAEMRAWWQAELAKKVERKAAAAKQAQMDSQRAEMRAWAEAKQATAKALPTVVEEPTEVADGEVAVEEKEDPQVAMDKARAEMRDWWTQKWDTKKKVMGWSPYAPVWMLEPAEGSVITSSVALTGNGIVVGSIACDPSEATPLVVDLPQVSAQHAKVYGMDLPRRDRRHERGYFVMDLGSKEGTFMNKLKLQPNKPFRIMDGDRLKFGDEKVALMVKKVASGPKPADEPSWAVWGP